MAKQPAFRKIQGIKDSANFDQAAGSKTRSIIEQRSRSKHGSDDGGGGGGLLGKVMGGLASHETGTMVDSGGAANVEGDPLMVPAKESQSALHTTAAGPSYTPGSLMDIITRNKTGEQNPGFNPEKPIGGDNVPYKETTGAGGWFKRVFGDKSNQLNAEAQSQQAANWRAEKALKDQQAREDARDMNKFNQQLAIQTNSDQARSDERAADRAARKEEQDEDRRRWAATETSNIYERENAEIARNAAAAAAKEQNDRMYNLHKAANDLAKTKLTNEQQEAANRVDVREGKDGTLTFVKGGNIYQYQNPQAPTKFAPGRVGGIRRVSLDGSSLPASGANDPQVDPATGKPIGAARSPAFMGGGNATTSQDEPEIHSPMGAVMAGGWNSLVGKVLGIRGGGGSMGVDGLSANPSAEGEVPFGPPQLMDQYWMRAKELIRSSRETPETAMYPLSGPLNRRIAAYLNVQPEQVGASRFSRTPERVVERDQDKYLTEFGQINPDYQKYAVDQALRESYKNPKAQRPAFGWQYE